MHLVPPIARKVARRLPPVYDLEDLIATGYAALLSIAVRYRPEAHGGTPFSAYARKRILGAILDAVRVRHVTQTRWHEMLPLDYAHGGTYAGESAGDWRRRARELRTEPDVEINIDAERLAGRVAAAIRRLTPLRAAILDRYYSPGLPSLERVAGELGIALARVAKERAAAIADLKRWLGV
jgi:RNA polymerase sigma factor (sigma-70 family)